MLPLFRSRSLFCHLTKSQNSQFPTRFQNVPILQGRIDSIVFHAPTRITTYQVRRFNSSNSNLDVNRLPNENKAKELEEGEEEWEMEEEEEGNVLNIDPIRQISKHPQGVPRNTQRGPLREGNLILEEFFEEFADISEEEKDELYTSRFQKRSFVPKTGKNWWVWLLGGYSNSSLIKKSARQAYEYTIWHVDNQDHFEKLFFANDIYGWFLFNLIHMWMIKIRLRGEGKNGEIYFNEYQKRFWEDVEMRFGLKYNQLQLPKEIRRLTKKASDVMVLLDIGLFFGDSSLADMIWQTLYQSEEGLEPSFVNATVHFIYREMQKLDSIDSKDLLYKGYVQWARPPLHKI